MCLPGDHASLEPVQVTWRETRSQVCFFGGGGEVLCFFSQRKISQAKSHGRSSVIHVLFNSLNFLCPHHSVWASLARSTGASWHIVRMENSKPYFSPVGAELTFWQDPQVILKHFNFQETLVYTTTALLLPSPHYSKVSKHPHFGSHSSSQTPYAGTWTTSWSTEIAHFKVFLMPSPKLCKTRSAGLCLECITQKFLCWKCNPQIYVLKKEKKPSGIISSSCGHEDRDLVVYPGMPSAAIRMEQEVLQQMPAAWSYNAQAPELS